jgi:hypothetical protein
VKILMPKMSYRPDERFEVIRQAYLGLFSLTAPMLFDKYVDFIDGYAEVRDEERERIYRSMTDREETAMLAQYIKDKGFQEGIQQGVRKGMQLGKQEGRRSLLARILAHRFGPLPDWANQRLETASSERLDQWAERVLEVQSLQDLLAEEPERPSNGHG